MFKVFNPRQSFGKRAEDEACRFLEQNGYRVLARNVRDRFAEIDIVARDKDTVCFVEVKARGSDRFGLPQEAVLGRKQAKLCLAAEKFLADRGWTDAPSRFDVVAVFAEKEKLRCELIKDAFGARE